MGKKIYVILIILWIPALFMAQSVKRRLLSANVFQFHQMIYVYGYEHLNSDLVFRCLSYDKKLQLKDSVNFSLGKHTASDYLDITVDTLHDVLNFYFQLANQKNKVSLLRCNDSLRKIGTAENYDANHINALSAFDDEKYAYKKNLYIIRTVPDTSGKQFYLSKYELKNMNKPFEYDDVWQYAFERKYVYRASILFADTNLVIVYAHVFDGLKKGQWILRINANNGKVIRGSKLSAKGDSRHFLMSNFIIDQKTKGIDVIGSIYNDNMIDFKNKTSNFTNQSKGHKIFLCNIDSLGDVTSRVEKAFPLPLQTKSGNILQSFHLKITEFSKKTDGSFAIWSDLYEQAQPNTFVYYSSWQFNLVPNDVDYEINRSVFTIGAKAIPNFPSLAKGDTDGKFILNDIGEYDKLKYKKPLNDVVIKTDFDNLRNTFYVFKKTDVLSAKKTYHYVFKGKKGLESKIILKSEQGQHANIFFPSVMSYITFLTNIGNTEFEIKLNTL
ncbi:MAG: hypothetical protein V4565_11195 [Bacteroidota bacterium]